MEFLKDINDKLINKDMIVTIEKGSSFGKIGYIVSLVNGKESFIEKDILESHIGDIQ